MFSYMRDNVKQRPLPTSPVVAATGGYLAFPPTLAPDGRVIFTFTKNQEHPEILREREEQAARAAEAERVERLKEEAWQERLRREASQAQLRAEALKGEMWWVSIGGSVLDEDGRRDPVRTAQVRELVRIRDEEERVIKPWNSYEARWHALLADAGPVTFALIPWPLPTPPKNIGQLVPAAIEKFLFSPLLVRQNTITRRERIRASLLRWHPDKMSGVLSRVVEEDRTVVRDGIHAVFRCLSSCKN